MAFKKTKWIQFLCSHFNIEDGRKKTYSAYIYFKKGIIMLYYFKKGKNTIEMQKKICAAYGESTVIEHVKNGLRSFMVEISH